jgi:hypothetical protein
MLSLWGHSRWWGQSERPGTAPLSLLLFIPGRQLSGQPKVQAAGGPGSNRALPSLPTGSWFPHLQLGYILETSHAPGRAKHNFYPASFTKHFLSACRVPDTAVGTVDTAADTWVKHLSSDLPASRGSHLPHTHTQQTCTHTHTHSHKHTADTHTHTHTHTADTHTHTADTHTHTHTHSRHAHTHAHTHTADTHTQHTHTHTHSIHTHTAHTHAQQTQQTRTHTHTHMHLSHKHRAKGAGRKASLLRQQVHRKLSLGKD